MSTGPDEAQDDVVNEFADGEDAGAEQQAHEATHLPEQAGHTERSLLRAALVGHVLVEDVHLQEVLPATKERGIL